MPDTIVAPATPRGESALAVVRMSGPDSFPVLAELADLAENELPEPRRATLLELYATASAGPSTDEDEGDREVLDRAVVVRYPEPDSYTGEDMVEFSLHGNPLLVESLMEEVADMAVRTAEPGEFTRRALLNEKMTPAEAEAVGQVIGARTRVGLKLARRNLEGRLRERLGELRDDLLDELAGVEVVFDYPGEESDATLDPSETLAESPERLAEAVDDLIAEARPLLEDFPELERLSEGARVAMWGAPNAGKSSLFNALLGAERALVAERPGTTRDYLESPLEMKGLDLTVIDTAGVREQAGEEVERAGIERTREQVGEADLVLVIGECGEFEAGEPPAADRAEVIYVATKADLVEDVPGSGNGSSPEDAVWTSAETGRGVEELRELISERLGGKVAGDRLLLSRHQFEELSAAVEALERARESLREGVEVDLIGLDLRDALEHISGLLELPGGDAVLDRVLSGFCVGK